MGAIVKVRNVKFGDGMPKICIPVTDTNLDALKKSVNLNRNTPFDLIEWRADFYTGMEDPEIRIKAMTLFRNSLGNIPRGRDDENDRCGSPPGRCEGRRFPPRLYRNAG